MSISTTNTLIGAGAMVVLTACNQGQVTEQPKQEVSTGPQTSLQRDFAYDQIATGAQNDKALPAMGELYARLGKKLSQPAKAAGEWPKGYLTTSFDTNSAFGTISCKLAPYTSCGVSVFGQKGEDGFIRATITGAEAGRMYDALDLQGWSGFKLENGKRTVSFEAGGKLSCTPDNCSLVISDQS